MEHILANCTNAQEVWHRVFDLLHINIQGPLEADEFMGRWLAARTGFIGADRRGFDTMVTAIAWTFWKQRNARVFNRANEQKTMFDLPFMILDEIVEWKMAGWA